jgi:hypothetical protein
MLYVDKVSVREDVSLPALSVLLECFVTASIWWSEKIFWLVILYKKDGRLVV